MCKNDTTTPTTATAMTAKTPTRALQESDHMKWSAEQAFAWVVSKSSELACYKDAFVEGQVRGEFLECLAGDPSSMSDIGINDAQHQALLCRHVVALVGSQSAPVQILATDQSNMDEMFALMEQEQGQVQLSAAAPVFMTHFAETVQRVTSQCARCNAQLNSLMDGEPPAGQGTKYWCYTCYNDWEASEAAEVPEVVEEVTAAKPAATCAPGAESPSAQLQTAEPETEPQTNPPTDMQQQNLPSRSSTAEEVVAWLGVDQTWSERRQSNIKQGFMDNRITGANVDLVSDDFLLVLCEVKSAMQRKAILSKLATLAA